MSVTLSSSLGLSGLLGLLGLLGLSGLSGPRPNDPFSIQYTYIYIYIHVRLLGLLGLYRVTT